jgi:hypothetical protein
MTDTVSITDKTAHLAWCAMIALLLAKRDGQAQSESQENLFLTRWFATALKQHRFPREVAPDIEWLLKQGQTLGARAKLRHKIDYLWRSCSGVLAEQTDLFRLTYALETARQHQWTYRLLTDKEWSGRYALTITGNTNAVFVSRSSLDAAFNEDGGQILPMMAKVTGDKSALNALLASCGWKTVPCQDETEPALYILTTNTQEPAA